jgi:hypothetical protein
MNRTLWTTRERSGGFSAAEQCSTHGTSYTGVQPVPWGGLPLLSLPDKAKVMGVGEDAIDQPRPGLLRQRRRHPAVLAGA